VSARDRKLMAALAPLAVFALYWMLLMNPALDRRAALEEPLAQAQTERDEAVARAAQLEAAQQRYKADYAELVKLSRAIPQTVAASDLMRELNAAADGTGIDFSNISMSGSDAPAAAQDDSAAAAPAGLDEIPVELTFDGRFFDLADLFHSIQRFVTVADGRLNVHGRLIRIDSFSFDSASFPEITARVSATVYAAPATEGPTDGATAAGPRGAERGDGGLEPVQSFSPAVVTP
jgi:Tfp pilus assembly protein PilO